MDDRPLRRLNIVRFQAALVTIVVGVARGIVGVGGAVSRDGDLLWKLLATDGIIFAGAVLIHLAIACYGKRGGDIA